MHIIIVAVGFFLILYFGIKELTQQDIFNDIQYWLASLCIERNVVTLKKVCIYFKALLCRFTEEDVMFPVYGSNTFVHILTHPIMIPYLTCRK